MKVNRRQQTDIIDLVQDQVPIIIDLRALLIDLDTDDISLVIHLVALVACVVLIESVIGSLVAAIPLIRAYQRRIPATIVGSPQGLIIVLNLNIFVLADHLIAGIGGIYLVQSVVEAQVTAIPLIGTNKSRVSAVIADSSEDLVVLLVMEIRFSPANMLPAIPDASARESCSDWRREHK